MAFPWHGLDDLKPFGQHQVVDPGVVQVVAKLRQRRACLPEAVNDGTDPFIGIRIGNSG